MANLNYKNFKNYYKTSNNKDIIEAIQNLSMNNKLMIPFNNYIKKTKEVILSFDKDGYPYIFYLDFKVYFPLNYSYQDILGSLNTHMIEQSNGSPHQYYVNPIKKQKTAILIGASDGFFAIDILNMFENIILIESDIAWIEPLSRTFNSYKSKINILNQYISNQTTTFTITLDDLFSNNNLSIDYIQADVEGAALSLLNGAKNILLNQQPTLSIACYHTQDEAEKLSLFLSSFNYQISLIKFI